MVRRVVSPHVVARCVGGRVCIHAGGPAQTLVGDDGEAFAVLAAFARPRTDDEACAVLPESLRPRAAVWIERLVQIGALVAADDVAAESDVEAAERALGRLGVVADAIDRIGGSVAAFGPHAEQGLRSTSGLGSLHRVDAILAAVTALEAELAGLRSEHFRRRLEALGVGADAGGLRLHLAGGERRIDGWVHVDIHPAELAMDLRWGLPFADGSAAYVYMAHALEHFRYPDETMAVLRDIRRVLSPGGRARFVVPDAEACLRAYIARDRAFFAGRRETWPWWPEPRTALEGTLGYLGASPPPGQFFASHKYGFDFETLEIVLRSAGFAAVQRSAFQGSDDPTLRIDDHSAVAAARWPGGEYSLFVDAM